MMKIYLSAVIAALSLFGCAGSESAGLSGTDTKYNVHDTSTEDNGDLSAKDMISAQDISSPEETKALDMADEVNDAAWADVTAEDVMFPGETIEETAIAPEVTSETNIEQDTAQPQALSPEKTEKMCDEYCVKLAECCKDGSAVYECGLIADGMEACKEGCAQQVVTDFDTAVKFICITVKGCDEMVVCDGAGETPEVCTELCEGIEECGNITFQLMEAESQYDCLVNCSGLHAGTTTGGVTYIKPLYDCIVAGLEAGCDSEQIYGCYQGFQCEDICKNFNECGNLEELFGDFSTCKAMCAQQSTGSTLAQSWCLNMGDCELSEECMAPPEEPLPEAALRMTERPQRPGSALRNPYVVTALQQQVLADQRHQRGGVLLAVVRDGDAEVAAVADGRRHHVRPGGPRSLLVAADAQPSSGEGRTAEAQRGEIKIVQRDAASMTAHVRLRATQPLSVPLSHATGASRGSPIGAILRSRG